MIEAPVEGASSRAAASDRVGKAKVGCLGDELSADPVQLLTTRITNLELAAIRCAAHSNRQPERLLELGRHCAELRALAARRPSRPVRAHPVLGLSNRQPARQHYLEPMLLGGYRIERDERPCMARGDRTGADRRL